MKPDFLICGTQKGGTTPVMNMLKNHPEVFMYEGEIDYFSMKTWRSKAWYESHFHYSLCIGEKSPSYMNTLGTAKRIYKYNPYVKLIFFLRNPIDRAYSQWNMNVRKGKENRDFHTCITSPEIHTLWGVYNYITRGFYDSQLKEYSKYFNKKQMLLVKTEWMYDNTQEAMDVITNFLNISRRKITPVKYKTNYTPLSWQDGRILENIYETESKNYMALESWL